MKQPFTHENIGLREMPQLLQIAHNVQPGLARSLCGTFGRLAEQVWTTLEAAHRTNLSYGEESITDAIVLDLALNHAREIALRKFTKREEGKTTGADWEWWLGDRSAWFGMRIQAKVLDATQQRYSSLGHRVAKSQKLQVKLLLDDAKKRGLYPAYCFYNFWSTKKLPVVWNCGSEPMQVRRYGCSIADASLVKMVIDQKKDRLADVAPFAFPWTCLVCCTRGSQPGDGFAGRARSFVDALLVRSAPRSRADDGRRRRRVPVPPLVQEPPAYVRQILAQADRADAHVDGLPAGIDGVLVIQDNETATAIPEPGRSPPRRKGRN